LDAKEAVASGAVVPAGALVIDRVVAGRAAGLKVAPSIIYCCGGSAIQVSAVLLFAIIAIGGQLLSCPTTGLKTKYPEALSPPERISTSFL